MNGHPHEDDSKAPNLSRVKEHGKMLSELGTKVDPDTAEAFRQLVTESGHTTASAIRDFIFKAVHGETYSEMVIREANDILAKTMRTGLGRALHGPR